MFGTQYYHQTLRKYVIMFGNLFNDIRVKRINAAGQVIQNLDVPIAYGPKQKFLVRLAQDPNLDRDVAVQLPRIGFELIGINYAGDRKLASTIRNRAVSITDNSVMKNQYTPTPYDINFQLSIFVKNADDGTQILEQILPFFTPEWTTTVNLIPEMNIKMDIPLVLQGVNYEDVYEGDFETRRTIIWTLDFIAKGYLYGPVRNSGVINRSVTNLFDALPRNTETAVANVAVVAGLTANGTPTNLANLTIERSQIFQDSDYGFITTVEENI